MTRCTNCSADMRAGYARYRAIGTKRMTIRTIAVHIIDELHCIADIGWRSTYRAIEVAGRDVLLVKRFDQ